MKKVFYDTDRNASALGERFQHFLERYPDGVIEHLVVSPVVLSTKDQAIACGSIFAVVEVPNDHI